MSKNFSIFISCVALTHDNNNTYLADLLDRLDPTFNSSCDEDGGDNVLLATTGDCELFIALVSSRLRRSLPTWSVKKESMTINTLSYP